MLDWSVNFSEGGWRQANTAVLFQSSRWSRNTFIPWFEETREWARAKVPQSLDQAAKMLPMWLSLDADGDYIGMPVS